MDFDFVKLKEILSAWQIGIQENGGWNALFWCNHDQPRIVSRFGDDKKYHKESAKMLATTMHMLRGTPYIYQGEEIGMTNPHFDKIELYKDVESINYYNILKGEGKPEEEIIKILGSKSRDNARTPVQWNGTKNAGFTTGEPFISVSDNYSEINVEKALEDTDSIFYHYKRLIELRKEYDVIAYGDFKPILEEDSQIFAYVRYYNEEKLLVINNFYGKHTIFNLPEGLNLQGEPKILLSNYSDTVNNIEELRLRPYEAVVFYIK
jgi:trehalose-6-phosphate hydrolase